MVNHLLLNSHSKTMTIEEICKKEGVMDSFSKSNRNGFYALSKKELIQEQKVLVCQHVSSDTWTDGAEAVRKLLDLPEGRITLGPSDIKKGYRLFVQSTSWNRKIPAGVTIMLEVTPAQRKKHATSDDVQNADEKETIGTKKYDKRHSKRGADTEEGDNESCLDETAYEKRKKYKSGGASK
eukprot:TRINITY_DN17964_c0_g1_i1.p1 TRINITY_DN17964_c0_g1~~TRINITY_DN17964_c0_g1_i1.p1  ORF type:complete len:202 (+),score=49.83 TRINITY_DN17964_c0_g1_i1:65-607(+)